MLRLLATARQWAPVALRNGAELLRRTGKADEATRFEQRAELVPDR